MLDLVYTAGLKMIPKDVYEAASLDGAGAWQTFRLIIWPLLLTLLAPALIVRGITAFNQFYLFFVFRTPFPLVTFTSLSYLFLDIGGRFTASAVINVF